MKLFQAEIKYYYALYKIECFAFLMVSTLDKKCEHTWFDVLKRCDDGLSLGTLRR